MFLMQNSESLNEIPDDMKKDFLDMDEKSKEKLQKLKLMITNTFPVSIFRYSWLATVNHFMPEAVII